MITENLLLALQFKKLEHLELKIDYENENEKETEDLIIKGPAYFYRIDEDLCFYVCKSGYHSPARM